MMLGVDVVGFIATTASVIYKRKESQPTKSIEGRMLDS
jgi:hypothetical protein